MERQRGAGLPGDGPPVRAGHRHHRRLHGHARPQRPALGGRRQGHAARRRRAARPRPDGRVRPPRLAQGPVERRSTCRSTRPTRCPRSSTWARSTASSSASSSRPLSRASSGTTRTSSRSARPATWDDLERSANLARRGDAKTWCIALGSDATTGWPGTDWIEDIVLRQSGPDVYDDWVAGRIPWTSPEIKSAFEFFGEVVADAYGGPAGIIGTDFEDGGNGLFSDPPHCIFHHQATFMTSFFESNAGAREGRVRLLPVPDARRAATPTPSPAAGDLFGMFNDTPQSRALMAYLLTPEAQSIWVSRGGALSVNTQRHRLSG